MYTNVTLSAAHKPLTGFTYCSCGIMACCDAWIQVTGFYKYSFHFSVLYKARQIWSIYANCKIVQWYFCVWCVCQTLIDIYTSLKGFCSNQLGQLKLHNPKLMPFSELFIWKNHSDVCNLMKSSRKSSNFQWLHNLGWLYKDIYHISFFFSWPRSLFFLWFHIDILISAISASKTQFMFLSKHIWIISLLLLM